MIYCERIFYFLIFTILTSTLFHILSKRIFKYLEEQKEYFKIYYLMIAAVLFYIATFIQFILYPSSQLLSIQNPFFKIFLLLLVSFWLTGCMLRTGHLISQIKNINKLRHTNIPVENQSVHTLYHQLCIQAKLKRKPIIYQNEQTLSPCLSGFFKKKIIIPYFDYNTLQLQVMLTHELYHYKHHDLFWRNCADFLTIICWFHPFFWYIRKDIIRWQEVICDLYCCRENPFHFTLKNYFSAILDNMETAYQRLYIRCEMTPTSTGGESQVCISGSSISHLIYALRGCAGIRICIMSAKADPNPAPRLAERVLNLIDTTQDTSEMLQERISRTLSYPLYKKLPNFSWLCRQLLFFLLIFSFIFTTISIISSTS